MTVKSSDIAPASDLSPLQRDYIDLRIGEKLVPTDETAERNRVAFAASVQLLQQENALLREQLLALKSRVDALE